MSFRLRLLTPWALAAASVAAAISLIVLGDTDTGALNTYHAWGILARHPGAAALAVIRLVGAGSALLLGASLARVGVAVHRGDVALARRSLGSVPAPVRAVLVLGLGGLLAGVVPGSAGASPLFVPPPGTAVLSPLDGPPTTRPTDPPATPTATTDPTVGRPAVTPLTALPAPATDPTAAPVPEPDPTPRAPGPTATPAPDPTAVPADPGDSCPGTVWVANSGEHWWAAAVAQLENVLGRPPTEEEADAYWRGCIAANRDRLIEPDEPDLVVPGQRLALPAPDPALLLPRTE